jgi:hypothetical protein
MIVFIIAVLVAQCFFDSRVIVKSGRGPTNGIFTIDIIIS